MIRTRFGLSTPAPMWRRAVKGVAVECCEHGCERVLPCNDLTVRGDTES